LRDHAWWQHGIVYQIYPRSFQDSNGDGVGDLRGILERLDYLQWLGVTSVWISPFYPSPMADFGYDVMDYNGVDPVFGSLADFDRLVAEMHRRDLKLILDFVPNHTSDQHPWFKESRASRTSAKRAWYVWRDPAPGGGPPSNWLSEFGGPAWTFDAQTGQYYYHAFLSQQPDLNWREPEVQHALHDVLRFWLARGVDGFRVDAIHMLVEDEELRDNPPNPMWREGMSPARRLIRVNTTDQPLTHELITGMRRVADEFEDRVLIGEAYLPIDRLMLYYGERLSGFHLPFNFHLLSTPWNADAIAELVRQYEAALPPGAWPNWVLGNHDRPRIASRVGASQARLAAMLLLTLRGTPTLYYGDEIGMQDVPVPPERMQDTWGKIVRGFGRDPCRTPMQWDAAPGAGFSRATPWLPLHPDAATVNVADQRDDPASMLDLYRALLRLRRDEPALAIGGYETVAADRDVLSYVRTHEGRRVVVALNFAADARSAPLPGRTAKILLSTYRDEAGEETPAVLALRAFEGIVAEIRDDRA
jgi:alpha-glucosidase